MSEIQTAEPFRSMRDLRSIIENLRKIPGSRPLSIALTNLETGAMWLQEHAKDVPPPISEAVPEPLAKPAFSSVTGRTQEQVAEAIRLGVIRPGHPDHPDTEDWDSSCEIMEYPADDKKPRIPPFKTLDDIVGTITPPNQ